MRWLVITVFGLDRRAYWIFGNWTLARAAVLDTPIAFS